MKRPVLKFIGWVLLLSVAWFGFWFASGLPRALTLRELSKTPGLLVYADETRAPRDYRFWASVIQALPTVGGIRNFLLQYCEATSSRIVLRGLHPVITPEEIAPLQGMDMIHFIDLQTGPHANEMIDQIVTKAPNVRILHLQGEVSNSGLKTICIGLPLLEDLFLAEATISGTLPEFESCLLNLQGVTFSNCNLDRDFMKTLENRPDVKIAIQ